MDFSKHYNLPNPLNGVESVADWEQKRTEIINLLCLEYGKILPTPESVCFIEESSEKAFASKVILKKGTVKVTVGGKTAEFKLNIAVPIGKEKCTPIVLLNFNSNIPDKYYPTEEIADRGYAVAAVNYNDISTDDKDFTTGIAPLFIDGERKPDDPGKIMLWAWGAMRIADCLEKEEWADMSKLSVIGHSRLGKTALLTGALDERFKYVHSNNAGCCGDSLFRVNAHFPEAEHIKNIVNVFPYWFCPGFADYIDRENDLPFDQHYVFSLIAPRFVNVASAQKDLWACPTAQYICCKAASEVYEFLGYKGFVGIDDIPEPGSVFHSGEIGYHIRTGSHFLSRTDWNMFLDFIEKHI